MHIKDVVLKASSQYVTSELTGKSFVSRCSSEVITYDKMAQKKQSRSWSPDKSIILIAFGFSLMGLIVASPVAAHSRVCQTKGCIDAAHLILKNMDTTFNPCDDFYQFACGTFIKETVIPEFKSSVSLFSKKNDLLQDKLKQTLEGELETDDPQTIKLLKSYYDVCLDTEKIEKSSIKEVKNVLKNLGNWPVLVGKSWSESNFDWKKLIYQLRKMGYTESMKSIIRFNIEIDEKDTTRNIITLDQAVTPLNQEYLSKGLEEKVVQAYYKYMVELATILGANREDAQKELAEPLNFEMGLAKISLATQERRNVSELYNLKTVRQLHLEFPYIPWNEYLNQIMSPHSNVDYEDEVVVRVPIFLESLSLLISKTPKRVLANYLVWRVIEESAGYMNEQVRMAKAEFSASMTGTRVEQPRSVQCIDYVSNNLPLAMGALYVRKHFDKKTKRDVETLVNELRESFEDMLKKVDWMDEETKKAAQTKVNSIITHVAYPDEFFDNEKIDKYFDSLHMDDSFLKSHLQLNLFNLGRKLEQFRKPVDKTDWLTGLHGKVAVVDAFYEPTENSVQIPAGILQGEFFTNTRPTYMNYGALAWIIGHEIAHGFDDQGSQYDKDGNLANWWDMETKKEYLKRVQCLVNQYSNYTVKEVGLKINGMNTLGENIADNGGIKNAYYAYREFEQQNGEEPRLPGLPYSPRQMFWISAANVFCSKFRPEALKNIVITDVHSPAEFRVVGSFLNMLEFAQDFECPVGSPMNPVKKCTIW